RSESVLGIGYSPCNEMTLMPARFVHKTLPRRRRYTREDVPSDTRHDGDLAAGCASRRLPRDRGRDASPRAAAAARGHALRSQRRGTEVPQAALARDRRDERGRVLTLLLRLRSDPARVLRFVADGVL